MTGDYLTGVRFQVVFLRRSPGSLMVLLTIPFLTLAIGQIFVHSGQSGLDDYAVLGPAVMAMWGMALMTSGDIIDVDRSNGTLEAVMAVPASLPAVVTGRVVLVTVTSLLAVPESLATARVVLGITIRIAHPGLLVATMMVTAMAMACTATAFSALFVLARSARMFQNSLSYPFYLLSGAVVPVALLPGWLHPAARLVFLSWSSDLVRACLQTSAVPDVATRMLVIAGLGLAGYGTALVMLRLVLHRVRSTGTAGYR